MRQIEIIKGTANEMEQLETLVNDFLAKTNGKVIDVTSTENIKPTGVKHKVLIYTIEYESGFEDMSIYLITLHQINIRIKQY